MVGILKHTKTCSCRTDRLAPLSRALPSSHAVIPSSVLSAICNVPAERYGLKHLMAAQAASSPQRVPGYSEYRHWKRKHRGRISTQYLGVYTKRKQTTHVRQSKVPEDQPANGMSTMRPTRRRPATCARIAPLIPRNACVK